MRKYNVTVYRENGLFETFEVECDDVIVEGKWAVFRRTDIPVFIISSECPPIIRLREK